MKKEDVKITISSANGKFVYLEADVTRALARKVESVLEENHAFIDTSYNDRAHKKHSEYL